MSEIALPPHLSRPPKGPLEILTNETRPPSEHPRLAGKLISILVASLNESNTIEFHGRGDYAHATDERLQRFVSELAEYGELSALISHSRSIMFPPGEDGALGSLAAIQEEWFYEFVVFERGLLPNPKWEIVRKVRPFQRDTKV